MRPHLEAMIVGAIGAALLVAGVIIGARNHAALLAPAPVPACSVEAVG